MNSFIYLKIPDLGLVQYFYYSIVFHDFANSKQEIPFFYNKLVHNKVQQR